MIENYLQKQDKIVFVFNGTELLKIGMFFGVEVKAAMVYFFFFFFRYIAIFLEILNSGLQNYAKLVSG